MTNIGFPFRPDTRGRTALTSNDDHIRDMIEQLLFTVPGERVNRPSFGSGLLQLVFSPNSETLASALQLSVQAALQEYLGDLIELQEVQIDAQDSTLYVQVQYTVRRTNEQRIARFQRGL
jgi:phage baseplate assembly protein W